MIIILKPLVLHQRLLKAIIPVQLLSELPGRFLLQPKRMELSLGTLYLTKPLEVAIMIARRDTKRLQVPQHKQT